MTRSSIKAAIAFGSSTTLDSLAADPRYHQSADKPTWIGYTPSCDMETPYYLLEVAAAKDAMNYTHEAKKLAPAFLTYSELTISFKNFSPELGANDGAHGIIHQGSSVIHATSRELLDPDVVDDPMTGYEQRIVFRFNLKSLNPNLPFTVGMTGIQVSEDNQLRFGEVDCTFDNSAK
jgi:hypothetical protein